MHDLMPVLLKILEEFSSDLVSGHTNEFSTIPFSTRIREFVSEFTKDSQEDTVLDINVANSPKIKGRF